MTKYHPYKTKRVLNIHKHVDGGWFWIKYSANPYVGCEHACTFCYSREEKYSHGIRAADFGKVVKIKTTAPELLHKELSKVPIDLISTGDYQPIEQKYRLSRKMLKVCYDLGFPVLIIERSPTVLNDLDILKKINKQNYAGVMFSISSHTSENYAEYFEPKSPKVEGRFEAMEKLAEAGITVGTAFMPILPFINDTEENLEQVVKKTKDHGGQYVLSGSLTLSDQQRRFFYESLKKYDRSLIPDYKNLYRGQYSPPPRYWIKLAKNIRALCQKYGIKDRMPRPIFHKKFATNKKIAEKLFLKIYDLELGRAPSYKIWSYRKATWAIDELEMPIEHVYEQMGLKGLENINNVGKSIAKEISVYLK